MDDLAPPLLEVDRCAELAGRDGGRPVDQVTAPSAVVAGWVDDDQLTDLVGRRPAEPVTVCQVEIVGAVWPFARYLIWVDGTFTVAEASTDPLPAAG